MGPLFVGDETTAAAYRLAGVEVRTADPDDARRAVREAVAEQPSLLLVTTEFARQLPEEELVDLFCGTAPPVLPVADAARAVPALDLVEWIRRGIVA